MKTLVVYPGPHIYKDTVFYLLDPDTGECLASHLCSSSSFAKRDLHDMRFERIEKWQERFRDKTEAKFINETNYSLDEIIEKTRITQN